MTFAENLCISLETAGHPKHCSETAFVDRDTSFFHRFLHLSTYTLQATVILLHFHRIAYH